MKLPAFSLLLSGLCLGALNARAELVAYYPFEEGSGSTVLDAAFNDATATPSDNGTIFGNASYTPGRVGNFALSLDGSSGFVRIEGGNSTNDIFNSTAAITFALWVNPAGLPSDVASLVFGSVTNAAFNSRAVIDLTSAGRVEVAARSADSDGFQSRLTSSTLSLNTWQHVAGVIDYPSDSIAIYLNGQLQTLLSGTTNFSANTTPATNSLETTLGSTGGAFEFFRGQLDDVRIYNEALTGAQIAALAVPEPSVTLSLGGAGALLLAFKSWGKGRRWRGMMVRPG